MNKVKVAKRVANLLVGCGTATVTNSIIRNNVVPANTFQTVSVALTSLVIASMASGATCTHVNARIDEAVEQWNQTNDSDEDAPIVND